MANWLLNERPYITVLLFLATFILFLTTVCPNTNWRDSAEFQVVAYQLGIAHPAGSPAYALIGKVFTFLPFGSIALKVNIAASFFGALLIALTFILASDCLGLIFPATEPKLCNLMGAMGAAFYAVSQSLWENSIVAEVYTLQNCFVVLIALLLVRSLCTRESKSLIYLAAFLFGLSTGAHIIMILYIPAFLLFLWLWHRKFLLWSHIGIIIMFVFLGASVYLYLPLRSSVNPYYDWGNPQTARDFIIHVTDRKDAKRHFFFPTDGFSTRLKRYGQYYAGDFGSAGVILGVLGSVMFLRHNPRLFLGLGAIFFSQWLFFIRYWPWASAFIATFVFFAIAIGVGLFVIYRKVGDLCGGKTGFHFSRQRLVNLLALFGLIHIACLGWPHWKANDRSNYWSPYEFYKYLYNQIETRGVLISSVYYFGTSYIQQCENYRPDVTNLFLSEILHPRFFNTVIPARYPLITIPQKEGAKVGEAIINANIMEHAFYWDPTSRNNQLVRESLQPDGLLFRVTPTPLPLSPETLKIHQGKIEAFFNTYSKVFSRYNDREENLLYSIALENIARFFYEHQIYGQSIAHLSLANRLTHGSVTILNGLGASYANAHRLLEAKQSFEESLQHEPTNKTTLENLGQLYLDTREYEKAYALFRRLLKKDPRNQKAFIGIGSYYENARDIAKASEAYQMAVAVNPQNALAKEARKKLSSVKSNLTKKEW